MVDIVARILSAVAALCVVLIIAGYSSVAVVLLGVLSAGWIFVLLPLLLWEE